MNISRLLLALLTAAVFPSCSALDPQGAATEASMRKDRLATAATLDMLVDADPVLMREVFFGAAATRKSTVAIEFMDLGVDADPAMLRERMLGRRATKSSSAVNLANDLADPDPVKKRRY